MSESFEARHPRAVMADAGDAMNAISSSDLVTQRTAESFSVLDVAGINYAEARYALDRNLFPNRIIVGSETFPTRIDGNWRLVKQHGNVIGDFTWTGWDYLGEVGIGRPRFATAAETRPAFMAPYPWLLAGCGDIEGSPVTVEVYRDADEVKLLINGRSLGRQAAGDSHRFRAEFEAVYEPGELIAIAYTGGAETGRHALRSATGPVLLRAEADRPVIITTGGELAYVTLTLTDAAGTCYTQADRPVCVEVAGPGVLLGFGCAVPSTEERFDATERHTYDGRALAVLRPTGPGKIRLIASAPECAPTEILVTVE